MIIAKIMKIIRKSNQIGQIMIILDSCWLLPSYSTVNTALKIPTDGVCSQVTSLNNSRSGRIVAVVGLSSLV